MLATLNNLMKNDAIASLQDWYKSRSVIDMPFLTLDPDVKVLGPIPGYLMASEQLQAIQSFREQHCDTDYLFSEFHEAIEARLAIDQRSFHFIAHKGSEVLGVVRITPGPFEISALSVELSAAAENFSSYLEVSRMILSKEGRKHNVGVLLCFGIVHWGKTSDHDGLIALCRPDNARRFGVLGFSPWLNKTFVVAGRENGTYRLMQSKWEGFVSKLEMLFGDGFTETLGIGKSPETR